MEDLGPLKDDPLDTIKEVSDKLTPDFNKDGKPWSPDDAFKDWTPPY